MLAIVLSICVLIFWQVFYAGPKVQEEQARQQNVEESAKIAPGTPPAVGAPPTVAPASSPNAAPEAGTPPQVGGITNTKSRDQVLAASKRIQIDTPSLKGSISLVGGRIDDIVLKKYRVTVEEDSDNITLLSPSGGPAAFYAEFGWLAQNGEKLKVPTKDTVWTAQGSAALTASSPLKLTYDNGEGIIFHRTISVDEDYLFTLKREVENNSGKPVTLYPFSLLSRHEKPEIEGFFILHEGLLGVLGEEGLQEIDYDDALEDKPATFKQKGGWIGITDKFWAAVLIPDQDRDYEARLSGTKRGESGSFQTDYLMNPITIATGGVQSISDRLFAGAKKVSIVDGYGEQEHIEKFELLIDWGWFYFLTKPLYFALDFLYKLFGNFGIAILAVTGAIKLILFPLANKSYVSMGKMKKLQPEVTRIRERFADDKVRQQQAMMDLYKKEKVNPMSGCLPILVQIPVFFSLYKVLFVSIDMRHAPFFGWIKDLSAPDPTTVFNLFGVIPWDPPSFLMVGVWPLLMGITMWVQMQLNPQQPDPVQRQIFAWMPVMFTFLLATFPAGLVIYWAWNNSLSILQQYVIMKRQGVEIDLLDNMGIAKIFKKFTQKS